MIDIVEEVIVVFDFIVGMFFVMGFVWVGNIFCFGYFCGLLVGLDRYEWFCVRGSRCCKF